MTPLEMKCWVIVLVGTVLTGIIFLMFGSITVRKLRKNSDTKDALGFEYVSGLSIMNVAYSFCWPRVFAGKIFANVNEKAPGFFTDSELLYQHTSVFDRILGRLFVCSQLITVGAFVLAVVINKWFK